MTCQISSASAFIIVDIGSSMLGWSKRLHNDLQKARQIVRWTKYFVYANLLPSYQMDGGR